MDYNASVQFISQLAKSLGTLCNGYIGFEEWVKVSGTLYLTLDTGKTIQCVIDEKVCRHDETSATLISNSSVAQEADPQQLAKEEITFDDRQDVVEEVIWEGDFEQLEPGALGNIHDLVQAATLTEHVAVSPRKGVPQPELQQFIVETSVEEEVDQKPIIEMVDTKPYLPRMAGEAPFKCQVCGASFTRNATLQVHYRKHTGEMPFKCDVCEKGFYDGGSLRKHRRVHTKEKPFSCEICNMAFAQSANLKRHRNTHLEKKSAEKNPHICELCSEGFTRKDALKRHKQVVHELTNINRCKACGKMFGDKLQLLVHVSKNKPCRRRKHM